MKVFAKYSYFLLYLFHKDPLFLNLKSQLFWCPFFLDKHHAGHQHHPHPCHWDICHLTNKKKHYWVEIQRSEYVPWTLSWSLFALDCKLVDSYQYCFEHHPHQCHHHMHPPHLSKGTQFVNNNIKLQTHTIFIYVHLICIIFFRAVISLANKSIIV